MMILTTILIINNMANNQNLKDAISTVIKENGNNEITGAILKSSLLSIINQFGSGAVFAGVAEPSTVPINNDVVAFYIATTNGTYSNFGGYSLTNNDFVIFSNKEGIYEVVAELNVSGINYLAPIEPGTIADRAELPTMKHNQKYTFEAKPGYYRFGSTEYDLAANKRWLFFGDGTTWSLVDMGKLPMPELQKVEAWKPDFYPEGSISFHNNATWKAEDDATSLDEPSESNKWVKVSGGSANPLDVLDSTSTSNPLSANMGRELDDKISGVKQGGVDEDSISLDKLTPEARDFIGSGGSISNNPDGEDLTSVDEGEVKVLKFKDRSYKPLNSSGLGYKILRLGADNKITSSDFATNTILEIRYDFDIDGGVLEMPENVTLKFNGGSIKNGTLVGDNTIIEAPLQKIFHDDVSFSGKWICEEAYPEWFGAISYPQNMNTSAWWWNTSSEVANGEDSSIAFNKAINFAQNSGGVVSAKNGVYKITQTVTIPNYVKLNIPSGSGVFGIMQGVGNKVIEADKDSSSWTVVQDGGYPPRTLKVNEYFDSDCMAVLFKMSARGTAIMGGGTISIALSRHTIGILIEGNQFATINMIFAPELDIKVVGGSTNRSIPDPSDLVIDKAWNDPDIIALGNPGDYAYSLLTKETRVKNSAGTAWTFWCNESEFNTCVRTEVLSNDNRIINLHANVWLDWGFRGIEVIGRNGGWFNQAIWKGTVSDMHSNYVSFFANTVQGLSGHDMSAQSYQVHPKMSSQCRIFALFGLTGGVISGNTWDLMWAPPARVRIAYEYGKRAQANDILIDGFRYERDESGYRSLNKGPLKRIKENFVPYVEQVNILQNVTGRGNRGLYANYNMLKRNWGKYNDYSNPYDYDNLGNKIGLLADDFPDEIPNRMFDEYNQNPITVIDTRNSDLTTSIFPINWVYSRVGDPLKLVIDYCITFPTHADSSLSDIYATILAGTSNQSSYTRVQTKRLKRASSMGDGSISLINSVIFDQLEIGLDFRHLYIMFTTPENSLPCTLDLYKIKLISSSYRGINNRYGVTSLRPDAAYKGFIYEDTSINATLVNKGDSDNQDWQVLPTEESGVWDIPLIEGISGALANYSKIGKQVALSGRISFSAPYEAGTNISIVLPYAPQFGGVYVIGDLTFTLGSTTTAQVKSSSIEANKPFNLNFKTV